MLKRLNSIEIAKSVRLHTIKSDKFKTYLIGIYMQRPLSNEEAAKNALLSQILTKATKTYPNFLDLNKKLENLYGTIVNSDIAKKGEKQIIQFKMQISDVNHICDKNIVNECLKIFNEIINEPAVENGSFIEKYFRQEKENLKEKIKSRINDKRKYAVDRCIEEMCKDEPFSIYEYGNLDELEKIDNDTLFSHYQNVLETSPIDIFFIGDIDEETSRKLISENFDFKRGDIIDIPRENIKKETYVKEVEDNLNVNQGKLTIGYRTNIPYESELYESSILFSSILGGGPNSKLFQNVREKKSLCYYIYSKIDKFKSIMLISSGIEFDNFDKTKKLIIDEVKKLQDGKFTEDDIEIAKKSIITSIKSLSDSPNMLIDFYFSQTLSGVSEDLDGIIAKIQRVKKDSIIEAGKKFKLDTIYFLNKNREERK
ncbi:Predicted Zn-dependent peptidase [Caminicella sporogenes DSM 14501]|uniref:Predicted Zn-dependent peptidase n=1 Tax=Caminicella sporogenes DSM 14501 TaxID=1121266 RepID=A0A1M6L084_9FIRM|nr:pitrilysin family protein [Caminicella sporogenes]SHJ64587.1 Predicted Zn-dependent peptidase [Caminicella sporogenes DSM 14501]